MKKLITIILILALALPAAALAEEMDPIVGNWYVLLEIPGTPFETVVPDYTQMIVILTFAEDGQIVYAEMDYKGTTVEMKQPRVWGKWEKKDGQYSVSLISVGTDEAFFHDDLLYVAAFSKGLYYGFRRLEPEDIYNEICRK